MAARPADGTGLFDQPGASAAVEEFCNELNQGLDYALQVEWSGDDADRFFQDNVAHYLGQRNVVPDPDYRQGQHRERRPGEPDFRNFDVDVTATAEDDLGATASFERVTDRAFGLRHAHLVFVYSTGTGDRAGTGTVMGGGSADDALPTVERCFFVPRRRTGDVMASQAAGEAVRETLQRAGHPDGTESALREALADVIDGGAPTTDELRAIAENRRVPAEGVLSVRPEFRWRVSYEPYLGRNRTPDRRPSAEARNDVTDVYPP